MLQILEQTHKEKVEMYSKCTKKELIEMLIESNRVLYSRASTIVYPETNVILGAY